ncbi:hypothetical protein [Flavobacterium sp. W21_SRS_FM6]|uniref:hypothetical protein n=1 Tax=Flavobacterium sp. W21_SRS_FM6 TaxID=3240268 RepID=UPI003F8D9FD3
MPQEDCCTGGYRYTISQTLMACSFYPGSNIVNAVSTNTLDKLPNIDNLKRLLQSLAVLDLVLCPEWDNRYYSFDAHWAPGESMASMRNGCGDSFTVLFTASGCFFKGFAHESTLSSWHQGNLKKWQVALNKVPAEFAHAVSEPAFDIDNISFCFWRLVGETSWSKASFATTETDDPDGSLFLLNCLVGDPRNYQEFAEDYFETDVPLAIIQHVYQQLPLTHRVIQQLNPELALADFYDELVDIGYPMNNSQH